ncbi:MAG: M20 family metallopeptidase [Duodenibacillus sp.]|nr:M20 family metallopeptidase [Duodenibacillus sp.]
MLESYLKDLEELVNVDCGTHNAAGVTFCAQVMKRHFDAIGFATEIVHFDDAHGCGLFATNKPGAGRYDVLLNAHLDTVFPDGTAAARPMKVEGGRVTGPGCGDCKAGVLGIFYAVRSLPADVRDRLAIAVAFNPDEEMGTRASRDWLMALARKSRCAFVGEASRAGGELVRSRKGIHRYDVTFRGVASHAGNDPLSGRSAILAACRFALEVGKLMDFEGKGTSVNAGVIRGGSASNVVADACTVGIDTRYLKDEDGDEIDAAIAAMMQRSWGEDITQECKTVSWRPAMPVSERTQALMDLAMKAAAMEGFAPGWKDVGGGSDANFMAKAGCPVIDGVAPSGGGFHSAKEYILVDSIEPRIRMLANMLALL